MVIAVECFYYLNNKRTVIKRWEVNEPNVKNIEICGEYPETFKSIKKYLDEIHFKSYYYNCHVNPEGHIYHVDFGSHTHFIEFYELYGG